MIDLTNMKVALICPKFYGYENYIANELRLRGATVYLIYENVEWVNVYYRFVYVYMPNRKPHLQKKYYTRKLKSILSNIDYLFVIRGSSLNLDIMKWIKNNIPVSCKTILYQWDGVKNNSSILDIVSFFDKVATFDLLDSEKYGWNYLPLFYIQDIANRNIHKNVDVLFICALHSNRAKILNKLKSLCKEKGYSLKAVVNFNRVLFWKYKYIDKKQEVIDADPRDLTFKPLSIKDSYNLYSSSKIVVDYTNINQSGYTMRTIEAFGNGCKLVTNNANIIRADFYNVNNIYVYDDNSFDIPDSFVNEPCHIFPEEIYEKYSLSNWIEQLLGVEL